MRQHIKQKILLIKPFMSRLCDPKTAGICGGQMVLSF